MFAGHVHFAATCRASPKEARIEMVHQFHDTLPSRCVIESFGVNIGSHEGRPLVSEVKTAAAEALSEGPQLHAVVPLDVPHGAGVPGAEDNTGCIVVLVELHFHLGVGQEKLPKFQCRNPEGSYGVVCRNDFRLRVECETLDCFLDWP